MTDEEKARHYLNFRRLTETLIVMLSLPFALVGGLWLLWWLGFNMSVAVAVGFIALFGVAVQNGIIMVANLNRVRESGVALREAILHYKEALAIVRKQKETGLWGGNLLAPAPSKAMGWKEVGTIYQYRRLLELGWPPDGRVFRFADRFLFRLLSRDDDPVLLVEFQRPAKSDPGLGLWARSIGGQAAAAAKWQEVLMAEKILSG